MAHHLGQCSSCACPLGGFAERCSFHSNWWRLPSLLALLAHCLGHRSFGDYAWRRMLSNRPAPEMVYKTF